MAIDISVIIPVYNAESFLEKCVKSVEEQSIDNYELIIIDDGSTDNSYEVANKLARHNNKIKIKKQMNQGQISARQKGINLAEGKYIVFLDADDFFHKDALSEIQKICKQNYDLIIYNMEEISEEGIRTPRKSLYKGDMKFNSDNDLEKLFTTCLEDGSLNSMCTKAVKKEVFSKTFDYSNYNELRNGEDFLQTLDILTNVNNAYYLDRVLYVYKRHSNSVTNRYNSSSFKSISITYERLIECLNLMGLNNVQNRNKCYNRYMHSTTSLVLSTMKKDEVSKKQFNLLLKEIITDNKFNYIFKRYNKRQFIFRRNFIAWLIYKRWIIFLNITKEIVKIVKR